MTRNSVTSPGGRSDASSTQGDDGDLYLPRPASSVGKKSTRRVGPSGAITLTAGNCVTQMHHYNHSFEVVVKAYNERFPTHPKMPMVKDTVVTNLKEYPDEGRVTYERTVVATADDVPWIVRRAIGMKDVTFKAQVVEDYRKREMTISSVNVTARKQLLLDETTVYLADRHDPNHCYFEQVATLSIPGLPTSVAKHMESFLSKKYEKGCDDGRTLDMELQEEWVVKNTPPPLWSDANPEKEKALRVKEDLEQGAGERPFFPCSDHTAYIRRILQGNARSGQA